ncbi:DUF4157 domain-containing protein [Deinococcus sp. HMF7620]|uniref:DUF4157 domain-containing protein n=2 Tax=Deinococcus arboris TaxID=2682977 RepID=A0A7C9LRV9_9DEIO|nr:DUF4157 domain-containing protein [Deinococcus arboris]
MERSFVSIFDDRLRRLKHASRMAVTQQDIPARPTAPALPWPALPTGRVTPPVSVSAPRRVVARLVTMPPTPAEPVLAPVAPAPPAPSPANRLAERLSFQSEPVPRTPDVAVPPVKAPEAFPSDPVWESEQQDPYGDTQEALEAGLLTSPPVQGMPPAPWSAEPAETPATSPAPRRALSFAETLALNQQLETLQPRDQGDLAEAAQPPVLSPSAPLLPAISPAEPVALPESRSALAEPSTTPAANRPQAQPPASAPLTPEREAPSIPVALPVTATVAEPAHSQLSLPEAQLPAVEESQVTTQDAQNLSQTAATAEPSSDSAIPAEEPPPLLSPLPADVRAAHEQERRELEALLRATNSDIPVRLPRRPRPVVLPRPAAPSVEEKEVKPAAPIPAEQSQSILARLNRYAELEASGEVSASMIPLHRMESWDDHHPDQNLAAEGQTTETASETVAPAPTPAVSNAAVPATPAPTRLKARASRAGHSKEARSASTRRKDTGTEADEEPDTALPRAASPPGEAVMSAPSMPQPGQPRQAFDDAEAVRLSDFEDATAESNDTVERPRLLTAPLQLPDLPALDRSPLNEIDPVMPQAISPELGARALMRQESSSPLLKRAPVEQEPPQIRSATSESAPPPAPIREPGATLPVAPLAKSVPEVREVRSPERLVPRGLEERGSLPEQLAPAVVPQQTINQPEASPSALVVDAAISKPVEAVQSPPSLPVASPTAQQPTVILPSVPVSRALEPQSEALASVPEPIQLISRRELVESRTPLPVPKAPVALSALPEASQADQLDSSISPLPAQLTTSSKRATPLVAAPTGQTPTPHIAVPAAVLPTFIPVPLQEESVPAPRPTPALNAQVLAAAASPLPAPLIPSLFKGQESRPTPTAAAPLPSLAATPPSSSNAVQRVEAPAQREGILQQTPNSTVPSSNPGDRAPEANASASLPLSATEILEPALTAWSAGPALSAPPRPNSIDSESARPQTTAPQALVIPESRPTRPDLAPQPAALSRPTVNGPRPVMPVQLVPSGAALPPEALLVPSAVQTSGTPTLPQNEPARWNPLTPARPVVEPVIQPVLPQFSTPAEVTRTESFGSMAPAIHWPAAPPLLPIPAPKADAAEPGRVAAPVEVTLPNVPTQLDGAQAVLPALTPALHPVLTMPALSEINNPRLPELATLGSLTPSPSPLVAPVAIAPVSAPWSGPQIAEAVQPGALPSAFPVAPSDLAVPVLRTPVFTEPSRAQPPTTKSGASALPGTPSLSALTASPLLPVTPPSSTSFDSRWSALQPARSLTEATWPDVGGLIPPVVQAASPVAPGLLALPNSAVVSPVSQTAPSLTPVAAPLGIQPISAGPALEAAQPIMPPAPLGRAPAEVRPPPARLGPPTLGKPRSASPLPSQPVVPGTLLEMPGQAPLAQAVQTAFQRDGHGQAFAPSVQAALQRTLGTDLGDVRVVQNVHVPAALKAAQAHGLTVGQTVFLAPETRLDTPAGLALAAHEVTHAVRHTRPNFVPEVLRRAAPQAQSHDEEGVALATEHAALREHTTRPDPVSVNWSRQGSQANRLPGLPAPWDAMPVWDEPASASTRHHAAPPAALPLPAAPPPQAGPTPWAHAAAADRPAPSSAPPPAASTPSVGRRVAPTPQVDLDQVAREVYARLRDRLGAELRRL